jgi:CO/xanthine dehydrogenase Mo-binding subunit
MFGFGESVNRIDSFAKVTGDAKFPGDFDFNDQYVMKVLFSERVHAVVKSVDTERAESLEGVALVLTAEDVPNNEFGLIVSDQPVLCGPKSNKQYADRVRCVADKIAIVIADTEEIAQKALKLITVTYEDLPVVTDVIEAFNSDSILLHPERGSNVFCQYRIRKGDIATAFSEAAVIVESEYNTPAQEHAYLQPEAGVSYFDEEGRITVVVGGQWVHEDQEQIAHSLNLDKERIRVIYPAIGGAFGGREDMSVQIILALAILRLKEKGKYKPVKIVWSREESIKGHHKRHPYKIRTKWGASKLGKITAAQVEIFADGGAYFSTSTKVLGNATLLCTGPYNIPNVKVDSYAVFTNNMPGGAFRGFGGPQAAFAAESQINKLAEILGIDPVEIRLMNTLKEGDLLSVGTPLPKGITIDKVIRKCAEDSGWTVNSDGKYSLSNMKLGEDIESYERHGVGFACGFKNVGFSFGAPENCWAIIELHGKSKIESAILRHAGAEVGQGSHTVFVQMAARALNLPMEKIQLFASDTATTLNSGSVSASRMTFMAGNAIIGAAQLAMSKWQNEERPAIAEYKYIPPKTTPLDPETGKSEPNFAYGYVAEAVESTVDLETGLIKINRVTVADDVGKAVNPQQVEGQIEGAIVQALGYTVLENFIQIGGKVITDRFSTYLIPTVLDIPGEMRSLVLENPDPIGPYGARGVGEMPYLPFAPALIHSIHDATKIWFDEFPLTPERVWKAIRTP